LFSLFGYTLWVSAYTRLILMPLATFCEGFSMRRFEDEVKPASNVIPLRRLRRSGPPWPKPASDEACKAVVDLDTVRKLVRTG